MTERVIKSPVFLFSAAIWSHLAHYCPGLKSFSKDLFFMFFSFILVAICILVSLLENRQIHYN